MPGVSGFASVQPIQPKLLDAMLRTMFHRQGYRVQSRSSERMVTGMVCLPQDEHSRFAVSQDERFLLSLYGRIYGLSSGNAKGLLKQYLSAGPSALAGLNGEYVISVWDRKDHRLTLVNDRMGLKPLFVWQDRDSFAWASELKSLAVIPDVSREIDREALSELLSFGHLQGEKTLLSSVKRVPGGSILNWQYGRLETSRYWQVAYRTGQTFKSREEAAEAFFVRFQTAVQRRLGSGPIGILLSGGLDSRFIAGTIRDLRPKDRILSWTTGHGHDHDSRFAAEVARAIGSEHEPLNIPENFLNSNASTYSWLLDGNISCDGSHRAILQRAIVRKVDTIWNGFMGDVLCGSNLLLKGKGLAEDSLIQMSSGHYQIAKGAETLAALLKAPVFESVAESAHEAYASIMRANPSAADLDRLSASIIERQLWGDSQAQVSVLGLDYQVMLPFADNDFVDFMLQLPVEYRFDRNLYVDVIRRYFPELGRIPRAGDGLPLIRSRVREALHWKCYLFYRETLPKLTAGRFRPHEYSAYVHCDEWFRAHSGSLIKAVLFDNAALEPFFDMDSVRSMVQDFIDRKEGCVSSKLLASMMSFALFRDRLDKTPVYEPYAAREAVLS